MSEEPQVVMSVRCISGTAETYVWGEANPIYIPRVGECIAFSENEEATRYIVRNVVWFYGVILPAKVTVFVEKHYM